MTKKLAEIVFDYLEQNQDLIDNPAHEIVIKALSTHQCP